MLLRQATLDGIVEGKIDLVFRRQKRPTVRAGGSLKTRAGVLDILAVDAVDDGAITARAAARAGFASPAEVLESMAGREGALYRIRVRFGGEDPRIALRNDKRMGKKVLAELQQRLDRLDKASKRGPWTRDVLRTIRDEPGRRAPDLAAERGLETKTFKADVRKLKALGLTQSLKVGYRLSPRGKAFLAKDD